MQSRILFILIVSLAAILLAACQSESNTPAAALEAYLQALAAKDEASLVNLSCPAWETQALLELDALQSVQTSLEGLACQTSDSTDGSAMVVCQGELLLSYSGENQAIDLSERSYRLEGQGRDWFVCGH